MTPTYSQLYIHIVFAVKNRQPILVANIEEDVYRYITGIVRNKQQKLLAINGMPDHVHIAIGLKPTCCISDLVREIKKSSTLFIREVCKQRGFSWQEGYGAFSCGHSSLDSLIMYIQHQKQHHQRINSKDEYKRLLNENNLEFEMESFSG
jgi:REP element-mobilizing transposase RayT